MTVHRVDADEARHARCALCGRHARELVRAGVRYLVRYLAGGLAPARWVCAACVQVANSAVRSAYEAVL